MLDLSCSKCSRKGKKDKIVLALTLLADATVPLYSSEMKADVIPKSLFREIEVGPKLGCHLKKLKFVSDQRLAA